MYTSSAFDFGEASDIWFCRTFRKLFYLSMSIILYPFVKPSSDDLLENVEFLSVWFFLYQREKAVRGSGSLAQRDPFSPIKSIVEGTLPLQCA